MAKLPSDLGQQLIDEIGSYAADPLGFVDFAFPWGALGTELVDVKGPREWQRAALDELGVKIRAGFDMMPILKAICSGHGIGKSALLAWVMLWAIGTFPDTKVLLTANTQQQLRTFRARALSPSPRATRRPGAPTRSRGRTTTLPHLPVCTIKASG